MIYSTEADCPPFGHGIATEFTIPKSTQPGLYQAQSAMSEKDRTLETIVAQGAIAVIREEEPNHVAPLIDALARAGITTIEITLTTPNALALIADHAGREDLLIGAGSVLDVRGAEAAFSAGARFFASPCCDPESIAAAIRADCVAVPGALTPNEILRAWQDGADIVKIFPMPTDGPHYLRSVRAPMPHIPLAPSGGITADNAADFLRAGARILNVGSWLTPGGKFLQDRVEETERRGGLLYAAIQSARQRG